ncbi:2-phospho-L-lactate guanylyltransferase [Tepidiforma flava]|uniref:Phosphoenolpyruvate guanylyltransferase n=1 Tax=Tepidiforma flava TaxID=3004094 RepID=A0ABY7M9Z5_9CHLR|nr:2-phospho-L-lactate guanylyltransferase [Tepidiforma flava]WBL37373.1 2-phospho-L-lactate guanylyltransferase [Tepidiforma flava]
MSLPVLIPVNRLDRAKGRLAPLLTEAEREELSLITLETVAHAAGAAALILTADPRVRERMAGRCRVLEEDPAAEGLNAQLEAAIARLRADGTIADRLLILHADLPLVRGWTIETLDAEDPGPGSAVLVRSRDGGTNAMLLHPPGRFPLAYGPGSFERHAAAARAAGMQVIESENRELKLDLDTPGDVAELLRTARGQQTAAGHYLLAIGADRRLAEARA